MKSIVLNKSIFARAALLTSAALLLCAPRSGKAEGDSVMIGFELVATPSPVPMTMPPAQPTPVPEEAPQFAETEETQQEASPEAAAKESPAPAVPGAAMTPLPYREPSPLPSPDDNEMSLLRKFFRCLIESRDADAPEALEKVREKNPARAAEIDELMAYWKVAETEGFVNMGVLPDGLPQDNSLCIVVMGYKLSDRGSMKPELKGRLEVALASAQKYPNAYILVTGGGTASGKDVTEAGKMAQWLRSKGIDKSRILEEDDSKSTNENIKYSYTLLTRHPEITSIAVVTSDYHIIRSCLLFEARFLMKGSGLRVVSNAAYDTGAKSVIEQRKMVADSVKRLYGVN
ncbi:MAG: ElyC/SanA/YdcF family protein [Clostridia bacterium]|nr:ElyC/SanA/YdcF family protein [Clostridia bacterium]